VIGGVVLALFAAVAVYLALNETVLTHDLLDADFGAGADPFVTDENDNYRLDVVDGNYRITAKAGAVDSGFPAVSYAWFAPGTANPATPILSTSDPARESASTAAANSSLSTET
jgi:hypothetical protein